MEIKKSKTLILLAQLGSPEAADAKSLRKYLKEFLSDPRVIDLNPVFWKIILNLFILPFRPKKSAELYSRIYEKETGEFPLIRITREQKIALAKEMGEGEVEVDYCFLLSNPRIKDFWNKWENMTDEVGRPLFEKILIVPLFPQYAEATILSAMDGFFHELKNRVRCPHVEFVTHFHHSKAFIDNSIRLINDTLSESPVDDFVISFHGIQKRRVSIKKDPYYRQCFETYFLIKQGLTQVSAERVHMTFQSRFGSEEWLGPYNDDYCENLAKNGTKRLGIYCASFVTDCLETIDEMGHELSHQLGELNCTLVRVPCLNTDKLWIRDFSKYLKTWATDFSHKSQLEYKLELKDYNTMEKIEGTQTEMSKETKATLKIIFLTLFLDLVGFSIIFPLFPHMAKHYLEVDGQNFFLNTIFNIVTSITGTGISAITDTKNIVLFGGILGAIYSLLQFVAAPYWGQLSDRIGRRPVLLVSVFGLLLSYILWFFSGSFTVLILARFVGGIMGGNISTATAVVGDITDKQNRSKGMAVIGISFALGFIIGPAMGGISSLYNIVEHHPALSAYGVNPFSMPAVVAFVLTAINFIWIYVKFKETLSAENKGKAREESRSINPLKLFRPLPFKGVNATNFSNFFFLTAFSGMEFTLTFLCLERLNYSSMDNAKMFIFIGVILTLVQGGYVRRKAHAVGEQKMAMRGILLIIPGLLLIANAYSSFLIYFGLFFLAAGSSMVIPCLTALVSLYAPESQQGHAVGIFRSLGALARVIGPLLASLIYWKLGPSSPYYLGPVVLLIPIYLLSRLPKVVK